jgi:hypothetical protein
MEFVISAYNAGDLIELTKSKVIPTQEDFKALIEHGIYKSAQTIYGLYKDMKNLVILKTNSGKILTQEGVVDISYAPAIMQNDKLLVPYDAISKIFGATTAKEGNNITISFGGTKVSFVLDSQSCTINGETVALKQVATEINGYVMLPLEDLAVALEKNCVWDRHNGLLTITDSGSVNVMNTATTLTKTAEVIARLGEMDDKRDVMFDSLN